MTATDSHLSGFPTLFTATEAASVLKVKTSWLEKQASSRKVPFTMLGGCYRFTTDHLLRIIEIFEASPRNHDERAEPPSRRSTRTRGAPTTAGRSVVAPLRPRPRRFPNASEAA